MKKYLASIFLFLIVNIIYSQETPINFSFKAGLNVTHLRIDTIFTKTIAQPVFGFNYLASINKRFALNLGLSVSNRGSNEGTTTKYRINFIDLQFMPTFKLLEGLYVEAGGQYAILYNSYIKVLDSQTASGERKIITEGYKSYPEFMVGVDVELEKTVHIGCRFTIPTKNIPYTNIQFTTNIFINPTKIGGDKQICTTIEDAVKNSSTVSKLVLQRKKLHEIPYQVFSMPNLEELILDGNEITEIPKEIAQLKKLKHLSVKHNKIATLPSEIGLLQNLERLELEYNNISSIPTELCYLPKLRFLIIGKNNLQFLPNEIENLGYLLELNIANSGVMLQVPNSLYKLRNLEYLYVDKTTLIPDAILNSPNTRYNYVDDSNSTSDTDDRIEPSRYLKIIVVSAF